MAKQVSYIEGSLVRSMLHFVGPFLCALILQNLYGTVDLFMVGRFASTADVSAVTIGSQVMGMVTYLILGLSTGTTVLMGRHFGAGDEKGLGRTVGTSILLFAALAALFTVLLIGLSGPIVSVMRTPEAAAAPARAYLLTCGGGIVFIIGYNLVSAMLNGLGDTRTPLLFVAVACVINILLDALLVGAAGLGAWGAALATISAQGGSVLFALLYLRRRGLGFRFMRRDIRADRLIVKNIFVIGTPVAVQNLLVGASFLFITAVINTMGLEASAAVGVVERIVGILFMPAVACGAAVATVSAQNLGAGQPLRARQGLWRGVAIALAPSVLLCLFCQFGGSLLVGFFNRDPEVIRLGAMYLRSYSLDVVFCSFVFSMNGYFNSMGYSWFTLLHSLVSTAAVRVPLSYLLSRLAGSTLFTVGFAAPASSALSLLMSTLFLLWIHRRGRGRTAPAGENLG